MLPAIPTSPRRSMCSSRSVVSSRSATRVSQGATLMRICLLTISRGGRGLAEARRQLVHAERRDDVGRDAEQLGDERAGTHGPGRADRELENEALRRAHGERVHEGARVDGALAAPAALL